MFTTVDYDGVNGATFERYADYWDPEAQRLDAIQWSVIADTEAVYNALRTDQIDLATLPPANIDRAAQDGLAVVSGPTRQVYYLNLNETRPGLDDVRVRRAIAQSINRHGIVDAVFFGQGAPASQLLPEGEVGHSDAIADDAFGFDPQGAAQLLAEAGYEPGELSYQLIGFPSSPVPEINQVIAEGLGQAGINVSIQTVDPTAVADTFFVRMEGDMMQGAWSGRPSAEQSIQLLHTSTGFANPGGYAPEGFDAMFMTALAATEDAERAAALDDLAQVAFDEVLSVPLVFPFTAVGAQPRVDGLQIYVTGKLEFRGVGIAG
jgi:peptide/nickel transport system substrate-binding protein